MAEHDMIDAYLAEVRKALGRRRDADMIVAEIQDHLRESVSRSVSSGADPVEAQRAALSDFGGTDVVARAFAARPNGRLSVPTDSTRKGGAVGIAAATLWVAVALVFGLAWLLQDGFPWDVGYLVGLVAVLWAGGLTVAFMWYLGDRHGRSLGPVAYAGMAITALGVAASFIAWAVPVWMSVEAAGIALVAWALLRAGILPRRPILLMGLALPISLAFFVVARATELGGVDEWGDVAAASAGAIVIGPALLALGLNGLGRHLAGESPVVLDPVAGSLGIPDN